MNSDFKDGIVRTKDEVICLCDKEGKFLCSLYNWKKEEKAQGYNIYLASDFYIPAVVDRKARYLIHNNDLIVILA